MGFVLFESSGTFNPSAYGLVPGDLLQVVCVGGGGGVAGTDYYVTDSSAQYGYSSKSVKFDGSASSFGSFLTAPGGVGGKDDYGQGGWIPDVPGVISFCKGISASGQVLPWCSGRVHGGYGPSYRVRADTGGAGFGAGAADGSSSYRSSSDSNANYNYQNPSWRGGSAGQFKEAAIVLASTDPINCVVGTGGVAYSFSVIQNGYRINNGNYTYFTRVYTSISCSAGAPGCVAVFW